MLLCKNVADKKGRRSNVNTCTKALLLNAILLVSISAQSAEATERVPPEVKYSFYGEITRVQRNVRYSMLGSRIYIGPLGLLVAEEGPPDDRGYTTGDSLVTFKILHAWKGVTARSFTVPLPNSVPLAVGIRYCLWMIDDPDDPPFIPHGVIYEFEEIEFGRRIKNRSIESWIERRKDQEINLNNLSESNDVTGIVHGSLLAFFIVIFASWYGVRRRKTKAKIQLIAAAFFLSPGNP